MAIISLCIRVTYLGQLTLLLVISSVLFFQALLICKSRNETDVYEMFPTSLLGPFYKFLLLANCSQLLYKQPLSTELA